MFSLNDSMRYLMRYKFPRLKRILADGGYSVYSGVNVPSVAF